MGEVSQSPNAAALDGQRIVRDYLSVVLREAGFEVSLAGESADGVGPERPLDVAVLGLDGEDRCAGGPSGPEAVRLIRARQPRARLVVLSGSERPELAENCMQAGAAAVLSKRTTTREELLATLRAAGGRPPNAAAKALLAGLTARQREVLAHVGQGHDNLKIAALLDITEHTVKAHMVAIYRKVRLENRVELALLARELPPPA